MKTWNVRCEVCEHTEEYQANLPSTRPGWSMLRRSDRMVDVCPSCMKKLDDASTGGHSARVWGKEWAPGGNW